MLKTVSDLLRSTTALDVAALEWEQEDIAVHESVAAIKECLREVTKAVRAIEKSDRS